MEYHDRFTASKTRTSLTLALFVPLFILGSLTPALGQKDKKKDKNNDASIEASSSNLKNLLPDTQKIDQTISEALGYWQIGDVDSLHKYYSDNIVIVSGDWEPPLIGWNNYLKSYLAQRARTASARLDRTNTYIKVYGNTAWCTYQWKFTATIDGKPAEVPGHTTLVLNKVGDHWAIVLDHSSGVAETRQAAAPSAVPAQPARP